jgi:hypothetical protein
MVRFGVNDTRRGDGWILQTLRCRSIAVVAAGLALSACAASHSSDDILGMGNVAATPSGFGQRDLSPQEKKVIIEAVAPSLKDAGAAKYHWAKFPSTVSGSVNYCATVDAGSPYPAYSGHQAYIVEARVSNGAVSSAVMGLIAGGKDFAVVTRMCAKYGLDPNSAS